MIKSAQLIILLILIYAQSCCDIICERQQYAKQIIEKVELYKEENKILPNSLKDIGIEFREDMAFYTKKSNEEYEVWYGTKPGISKIYNSKTKKWREEG